MTKEEEKAIERLTNGKKIDFNTLIRKFKKEGIENFVITKKEYIETVLNMLKEKDKEIEKKDKIIDEMAKKLNQAYFDENKFEIWFEKMMGVQEKMDYGYVVPLIKQYFERKARNE